MAYVDLNDAVIAQVRQSANLVDFISQVTPLKAAGKSYKGLCPFHREKTPSFHVDRDRGLFYCFGCGTGGDIFKFLILTERFTFPEAVEHVASRVGIALPSKKKSARESGKDSLLEILDEAAAAFRQALGWKPNSAETYLRERGITVEVWEKYGFGYAPDSWDFLLNRLGGKHSTEQLEAVGVILPRKTGGSGYYDRFRNRLMIPIHSDAGQVIGFGGRTLDGSDPKYLNSPESAIFNKSTLLYNLHRAKDQMRKLERAVLVEGYFDAIAPDHSGIPGVVASMGTSLTAGQASLLRRYAKRVLISYDGDSAGRAAVLRAAPILLSAGLAVEVLDVGAGEDPDTLIKRDGVEGYRNAIDAASDVFTFALRESVPNPSQLSSAEKNEHLDQFVPLLMAVADPVMRNDAAQRVADGLRLEFETVWGRVRSRGGRIAARGSSSAPISTGEKRVLRAALGEDFPRALLSRVQAEFFEDPVCKTIFLEIEKAISEGQALDFSAIATHLKGDTDLTRLAELALGEETDELDLKSLEDTIRLMERRFLDRRLKEIQIGLQEALREGDSRREEELLSQKQDLSRKLHALK